MRTPRNGADPRAPDSGRTVSALFAQAYVMFGVKHGLNPQDMCAAAGLRPADIADRDSQIPFSWADALRTQLREHLPQLALGLELGKVASLDQLGYLGQALRNCETPLEGLKLLARSARLLDSAYRHGTVVVESQDLVELRTPLIADDRPEGIEMGFANIVQCLRALISDAHPRQVRFAHDRDAALVRRCEALFGCPVHVRAGGNALVFDRATMERPIPGADEQARVHFSAHVGKMLDQLEEPLPTVVMRAIASLLGRADVSQARVAKLLGLSTRALRRALHEQGSSYQQLLGAARRTRAETLLANRALAVHEIAFALSYDDVSAFTRAFRQWTGVSPRAFRENVGAASRAKGA